ncbi:MAG: signal recognition particle protein, partial [bacterium]
GMIPGLGRQIKDLKVDEKELTRIEAIICSMTPLERQKPQIINGSRRRRIALGSGSRVQDVNQLLKQFEQVKTMMKRMGKMKGKPGRMPPIPFPMG